MRVTLSLCAALVVMAAACDGPKDPRTRGAQRFDQCTPCHGHNGEGKPNLAAPPIAGLPQWYVESQLYNFRAGYRGSHFDDLAGMRMRPMSLTMPKEEDVVAVSMHVASLPAPGPLPATLDGAAEQGKAQYAAVCIACHAADGGGNKALNAPAIAGHPDWYVFSSLQKFKAGVRGAHPKDTNGAAMAAIAKTIADETAMKNLAAYVASMPKKNNG